MLKGDRIIALLYFCPEPGGEQFVPSGLFLKMKWFQNETRYARH